MRIRDPLLLVLALSLGSSICGYAEDLDDKVGKVTGQGYVFFGWGPYEHVTTILRCAQFGGGGEVLVYKGLGVGAEISAVRLQQHFLSPGLNFGNAINLFSLDGSYHFARSRKISPFVAAGYSLGFGDERINLINFGGGIYYWFSQRIGLRLEFRDHMYFKDYNGLVSSGWATSDRNQIATIRAGISFR